MVAMLAEEALWAVGRQPATVTAEEGEAIFDRESRVAVTDGILQQLLDRGWPLFNPETILDPLDLFVSWARRQRIPAWVSTEFPSAEVVRVLVDTGRTALPVWTDDELMRLLKLMKWCRD